MAREMTPQERAAAIITGCPEVWDRPCYMTQRTFVALVNRIVAHDTQTRRAALRECLEVARADGNIIAVREQLTRLAQEG